MDVPASILITGGAGFLARAIYRRARREDWRTRFTAVSRGDATHARLQTMYPEVRQVRLDIGIEQNRSLLTAAMAGHEMVIHAAATKYVDLAEAAARNTTAINVDGSSMVLDAARDAGIDCLVGISTDKACRPVNVYGMTKALMERLIAEAAHLADRPWYSVRYGNVVGSTGSVIPLFREQARKGTVRITDPAMTRFWMPVDEAIDLIFAAPAVAERGSVVIPAPKAMEIGDVALAAAEVEGLTPDYEVIGQRPGEKIDEELMHRQESYRARRHIGPQQFGGRQLFELVAPWQAYINQEPFELVSSDPLGGWLSVECMAELIMDAETV